MPSPPLVLATRTDSQAPKPRLAIKVCEYQILHYGCPCSRPTLVSSYSGARHHESCRREAARKDTQHIKVEKLCGACVDAIIVSIEDLNRSVNTYQKKVKMTDEVDPPWWFSIPVALDKGNGRIERDVVNIKMAAWSAGLDRTINVKGKFHSEGSTWTATLPGLVADKNTAADEKTGGIELVLYEVTTIQEVVQYKILKSKETKLEETKSKAQTFEKAKGKEQVKRRHKSTR